MQASRDEATHKLKIVKLELIFHASIHCKVVEGLTDIRCVRLIMVCDLFISCGQMSDEVDQIRELQVALGKETLPSQDVG